MLARVAFASRRLLKPTCARVSVRSLGDHSHGHGHSAKAGEVVVPDLFTSLEWLVDSPPTAHSFEEPPVSA